MSGKIGVQIGVTGLEQLNQAKRDLDRIGSATKEIKAAFATASNSLTQFVSKVKASQTSLEELLVASRTNHKEFSKLKVGLESAAQTAGKLRKEFVELSVTQRMYAKAMQSTGDTQLRQLANLKAEAKALRDLEASFNKQISVRAKIIGLKNGETQAAAKALAMDRAELAIQEAKTSEYHREVEAIMRARIARAGLTVAETEAALAAVGLSTAEKKVAANTLQAGNAAKGASTSFTMFGSAVRGAAGAMGKLWLAYGQLLPLLGAFAAVGATKEAMSLGVAFEYTTTYVHSLGEASREANVPLGALKKQLMSFEGLRHTPTELADGMRQFARAGVSSAEVLKKLESGMSNLETMSKFATIAEMDLGEAIKAVIGLTRAYQPVMLKATGQIFEFSDAANILAAAALSSSTEVEEMTNAFSHAAEVGIVSGMRFEETAAALAIMANAGIRGTKAATAIRTGLLKMATSGEKANKTLAGLGRKFNAMRKDGSAKNLVEVFKELNRVTEGLTDQRRIKFLYDLFGLRSMKAGAVLSSQIKEIDKYVKKLKEAAEGVGFIEDKYQDLARTAKAELDYLKVAVEKTFLGAVDPSGMAETLYDITETVKELSPAVKILGGLFGSLGHDLLNVGLALATLKHIRWIVDLGSQLALAATEGRFFADSITIIKEKFSELGLSIQNWNIAQWLREEFEIVDILGTKLVKRLLLELEDLRHGWVTLGTEIKIIFAKTVNSVIDNMMMIPTAFSNIIQFTFDALAAKYEDFPILGPKLKESILEAKGLFVGLSGAASSTINDHLRVDVDALKADYSELNVLHEQNKSNIEADAAAHLETLKVERERQEAAEKALATARDAENAQIKMSDAARLHAAEAEAGLNIVTLSAEETKRTIDLITNALQSLGVESKKGKLTEGFEGIDSAVNDIGLAVKNLNLSTFPLENLNSLFKQFGLDVKEFTAVDLEKLKEKLKETFATKTLEDYSESVKTAFGRADKGASKFQKEMLKLQKVFDKKKKDAHELYGTDNRQELEKALKILNLEFQNAIDNSDTLTRAGKNIFKGFKFGLRKAKQELITLGEIGFQIAGDLKTAFHDTFYAGLKGDFDSIADIWKSLLDNMLNKFLSFIADMLAEWAMSGLASLVLGVGGGAGGFLGSLLNNKNDGGSGGSGAIGAGASVAGGLYEMVTGTSLMASLGAYLGLQGGGSQVLTLGALEAATAVTPAIAPATIAPAVAPTAAAPATATLGGMSLSSIAAVALPAVGIAGLTYLMYQAFTKERPPSYTELLNTAGVGPEAFASVVSDTFVESIDPIYGHIEHQMMDANSGLLSRVNFDKTMADMMVFDQVTQKWQHVNDSWLTMMDHTASETDRLTYAMQAEAATGISGMANSLMQSSDIMMSSSDRVKAALRGIGIEGGYLVGAMEKVDAALTSAGGDTLELERHLKNLGATESEIAQVTKALTAELDVSTNGLNVTTDLLKSLGFQFDDLEDSLLDVAESVEMVVGVAGSALSELFTMSPEEAEATSTNQHGGYLGYARGGVLQGGSHKRDDLYVGRVNGKIQLAQGGEYIINPRSTKKHRRTLDMINADRYALGGPGKGGGFPWSNFDPSKPLPVWQPDSTPKPPLGKEGEYLDFIKDLGRQMSLLGKTGLDKSILDLRYKYEDLIKTAKSLGASELDLIKIQEMHDKELAAAKALEKEKLAAEKKARQDYMLSITDQIAAMSSTDLENSIRETTRATEESIEQAKELGVSESGLAKIRELGALQVNQLIEENKKQINSFNQSVQDQINAFSMTDQEIAIRDISKAIEEQIKQGKELGVAQEDLNKLRELEALQIKEVMNKGLKEAVTSMQSFKNSLASAGDESLKSANAQQKLFDVLSQAKSGDFSGVEKIGEVLNDISLDKTKYATALDYARDYWKTMNAVSELEELTNNQITEPGSGGIGVAHEPQDRLTHAGSQAVVPLNPPPGFSSSAPIIKGTPGTAQIDSSQREMAEWLKKIQEAIIRGDLQISKNTLRMAKLIERWEKIGLPEERAA